MKILRAAIGLLLLVAGVFVIRYASAAGAIGIPVFVVFAAALGILAGIFLHPYVSGPIASLAGRLFMPDGGPDPRQEFSRARALMVEDRYEEAAASVRETLATHPGNVDGEVLLATLLHEHLEQAEEALSLCLKWLEDQPWDDEHERLVMLAVDIDLDLGRHEAAVALLEHYAQLAGRSGAGRRLRERLESTR